MHTWESVWEERGGCRIFSWRVRRGGSYTVHLCCNSLCFVWVGNPQSECHMRRWSINKGVQWNILTVTSWWRLGANSIASWFQRNIPIRYYPMKYSNCHTMVTPRSKQYCQMILWTKQTILSDAILSSRMSEGNANNKQISLILLLNFWPNNGWFFVTF